MIHISKPYINYQEINSVTKVMRSGNLTQGGMVKKLEKIICKLCNAKYAIATNNGTSALHAALIACGVSKGDEVITTSLSFIASTNAIVMAGATPVFADVDEKTFNIDPTIIEKKITKKTKAILAVNLFGQTADYDKINKIAKQNNLLVIEDAAQSINASYGKKKSGNLADISCFSFYATKNITSAEGGMIITNSKKFYEKAKILINHGQENKQYNYVRLGYNYRLTDIQAAIALEQMKKIDFITRKRRSIAKIYTAGLKNLKGLTIPFESPNVFHVFNQYTIKISDKFPVSRNNFIKKLAKKNIQTKIYYPQPLFSIPHLKQYDKKFKMPIVSSIVKEVVSLPIYPALTIQEINLIIKTIRNI